MNLFKLTIDKFLCLSVDADGYGYRKMKPFTLVFQQTLLSSNNINIVA